jgi:coenzyme PQQ precursor peptide PqqA
MALNPTTKIAITKLFKRALILKKTRSLEGAKRRGDHQAAGGDADSLKSEYAFRRERSQRTLGGVLPTAGTLESSRFFCAVFVVDEDQSMKGEGNMTWRTPRIVEIAVGLEINMYACAVRK